jgi:dipeptidyl aminopeptidase/acylaminoacyl peptidase
LIRHPETGKIVGIRITRVASTTIWLDQGYADLQRKIEALFPGMLVAIQGFDASVEHVVARAFSDVSPAAYYLVDLAKARVDRIASAAPWIESSRMCKMQMIQYKTRDGLSISGYLTLPAGASKQSPAPLVVLSHGGPWARDRWCWDEETQFLASRGYAVFQPNSRGSVGMQWKFSTADMWDFNKMSSDVTDGVRKLLKTGLVDPSRVAIMGSSFGGYLALSGAVDEPDLYRCAVTIAGVYDWALLIKSRRSNIYGSPLQYENFIRRLGDPSAEKEKFAAISPLNRLDHLKIPVFVAHGRGDEVVDYNQAKRLVSELAKRNIPYVSLIKNGEGHGMARFDDRVEMYTAIETFLAQNMRKPAEAPP